MFPILVAVYVHLAKREEEMAIEDFGGKYIQYMKTTPAWIPKFKIGDSAYAS